MMLRIPACEAAPTDTRSGKAEPSGDCSTLWAEAMVAAQQVVPGARPLQPGWCAMSARGPSRFYGGEAAAALVLRSGLPASLATTAIVSVASGRFVARAAAEVVTATVPSVQSTPSIKFLYSPAPGVGIVEANDTAEFLDSLPVSFIEDEELTAVLTSLGVRTLGAFARLPEASVLQRFGMSGALAHRRARGLGEPHAAELPQHELPPDLDIAVEFEPPLDGADQLAFACGSPAEQFVRGLAAHGLVCTELQIELRDDTETRHERVWAHPTRFSAADVVNRVRWQASALPSAGERSGAGITSVRLRPVRTALASEHEPGLWNTAPDERVHHQLTRVQSLVGHEGVGTGQRRGGRLSADRQRLVSWGTAQTHAQHLDGPWPGSLTGFLPIAVFATPFPVDLRDTAGHTVLIDDDDLLSDAPASLSFAASRTERVIAWSAPWPLREQWWLASRRTSHRVQLALERGDGWLLRYERQTGWLAEGRYN